MIRACDYCSASLDGRKQTARYCSSACKAADHRARKGHPAAPALSRFWNGFASVRRPDPRPGVRSRPHGATRPV